MRTEEEVLAHLDKLERAMDIAIANTKKLQKLQHAIMALYPFDETLDDAMMDHGLFTEWQDLKNVLKDQGVTS